MSHTFPCATVSRALIQDALTTSATRAKFVGALQRVGMPFFIPMSEGRSERRTQLRESQKQFEALALQIQLAIDEMPDDEEFKQAVIMAMREPQQTEHPNNLIAAQLVLACIQSFKRGDSGPITKLMLFISGAVVNEAIAINVLASIQGKR